MGHVGTRRSALIRGRRARLVARRPAAHRAGDASAEASTCTNYRPGARTHRVGACVAWEAKAEPATDTAVAPRAMDGGAFSTPGIVGSTRRWQRSRDEFSGADGSIGIEIEPAATAA